MDPTHFDSVTIFLHTPELAVGCSVAASARSCWSLSL